MGVAPEATGEYLYLTVGSTFISTDQLYIFVLHMMLLSEVAPEHLIKNLYLIKGSALFFHVAFYEAVESNFFFCQGDVIADDNHDC